MQLIGITGAIGHGKSTLAEAFLKLEPTAIHDESSKLISKIANEIKSNLPHTVEIPLINQWLTSSTPKLSTLLHTQIDTADLLIEPDTDLGSPEFSKLVEYMKLVKNKPHLHSEHISEATKSNHRSLLQWLGGYLVNHVSRTIWYDELIRRAKTARKNGCKLYIIGGLRFPEDAYTISNAGGIVIKIIRPSIELSDTSDPTERERSNITYDIQIENNGNLQHLKSITKTIYTDIKNNTFMSQYTSRAK